MIYVYYQLLFSLIGCIIIILSSSLFIGDDNNNKSVMIIDRSMVVGENIHPQKDREERTAI